MTLALRLSLYYALFFVAVGVYLPFWPLWLASRGLTPVEIGLVSATSIAVRALASPLAAHVADRSGERRRLMTVLGVGAVLLFALFALARDFWTILAVTMAYMVFWSPIGPLGESLVMLAIGKAGLSYGRVRLWGSASFILAAVATGHLLVEGSPDLVLWGLVGAMAALAAAIPLLPDERTPRAAGRLPLLAVLRDRRFLLFLAAAAFIQSSHAVYYTFGTLHWRAAGYGADLIGGLWAEGVIAEILLFLAGTAPVRRLGAERLLLLGGIAAALRWTVLGLSTDTLAVAAAQVLHAFTFGAAHLGAIHYIARTVPPQLSATAQSLYAAVVMGVAFGLTVLAAGPAYAAWGGSAYLAMAVLGAVGTLLAWRLFRTSPE